MEDITAAETQEMQQLLEPIFGAQVHTWRITLQTYEVFSRLVAKSGRCTGAMHLVPRPYNLSAPVRWAQRQVRQALRRHFLTREGNHYLVCMRTAGLAMRYDFWEAQNAPQ
ncbi:hypothetical protein [Denitromonas iodatirespirans]|uniref:Uncharacterized protein n=1 Tax=Denitromonas iodatirespirans TaxID=2795389 RepID=A0A944DDJ6_DENI1|nr:hypothetical protein [Denitromonas iodatirespirans]MBT0962372.1 hypothetical protein [Denitromonas iodatirespirans]